MKLFALILAFLMTVFVIQSHTHAASRHRTLIIGMDISDGKTYDPSRQFEVTTPFTMGNVYETLITATPDNYENLKPSLAKKWELSNSGKSWRFYLRDNAKFSNGDNVTAYDVKFSFDRLMNLKDQPAILAENIENVVVIDEKTLDIFMVNDKESFLPILTSVSFSIMSKNQIEKLGGISDTSAKDKDVATKHLNEKSYGSGPYRMVRWVRNELVDLERNPFWHEATYFERVIIRHIPDGSSQLLALRRNDIDIAFNLSNEQVELAKTRNFKVVTEPSLDYTYLALTNNSEFNSALSDRNARLAIAHAIDYDGIIKEIVGGYGVRPSSILPIGIGGSTIEQTKKFGYTFDPNKAKEYLSRSSSPNGFKFNFHYSATSSFWNIRSSLVAQKIQSDLSKVGIVANLVPVDQPNLWTLYRGGKLHAGLMSWTIDALDANLWAKPFVGRIADRMFWKPDQNLISLMEKAAVENDLLTRNSLYEQYQKHMIESATFINLVQPTFRVVTNQNLKNVVLTAAGWYMNLKDIKR